MYLKKKLKLKLITQLLERLLLLIFQKDASVEEIEEAVIESLAETLGIHPKDIEIISIDPISGEVEFEIKQDSFEKAKEIQESIQKHYF